MTETPNGNSLLRASGVGRRVPLTDNWLLRDVDINIECGDRIAIVGPTGSGKTLMLRALTCLDPIDAGEIRWRNELLQGDAIPRFRREAIYLHQRPALFEGTVEDNLRWPFSVRSHGDREYSGETILRLLEQVNRTASFLSQSSRELSGGEAQIVALLRAIQLEPVLLLLDEPTGSLDRESTLLIEKLISAWFEASPNQRATLWVSHDRDQVTRVANRVMSICAGKVTPIELSEHVL
jgi:putative ABC transport system ATP-binding protein